MIGKRLMRERQGDKDEITFKINGYGIASSYFSGSDYIFRRVCPDTTGSWRSGIWDITFKRLNIFETKSKFSLFVADETKVFNCFDKIDKQTDIGWNASTPIDFIRKSKGQSISGSDDIFDNKKENDFWKIF